VQTHSDDLVAFIRGLGAGPVHLVAWSSAGEAVLRTALSHTDLVRSAFVFEGVMRGAIGDAAELKAFGDEGGAMFGAAAQALKSGDNAAAVREVIDAVGERKGYFDAQPASARAVQLDNARTLPLDFDPAPAPPFGCAQLRQIKPRVAIVRGADVRPRYRIASDALARCMPAARYIVVPDPGRHRHMWPAGDAEAFSATLESFLKGR
jgi:pimeloyl-ACP methyl ester carboxylesterase